MRRTLASSAVIVFLLPVLAWAQIVTEEVITTDSVDLFAAPDSTGTSAGWAMVQTLLVPGLGHQYLGKPRRALTYLGAEALFVFGAILCERYSDRLTEDSRRFAWTYAGAQGGTGADERYWRQVGLYLDADEYNRVQELNRTPEDKYVAPNLQWAWPDESYMDDYVGRRDNATSLHVVSTFLIAAMVLNRVVSFIDVRVTTLRRSRDRATTLRPHVSDGLRRVGLLLQHRF
jgi:hypothetical protein